MIRVYSLAPTDLVRFLERHKFALTMAAAFDLDQVLREILQKANEFVPSEAGSILLDDPLKKSTPRRNNELAFIATFGPGSEGLVGTTLSAREGIAGRVYETGTPYLSQNVDGDRYFLSRIDEQFGFKTQSVVAVPIYIGKEVCGVLELVNRREGMQFVERDRTLLEIFAGYTSFTLQNALDAKRAHELAKRDDLTGLYNDRWLHFALGETLRDSVDRRRPFVVMFLDLDNFKGINDTHGHLAGSQVLREVGYILTRVVPEESATISRYGGDEFVLILPDATLERGVEIASTIKQTIQDHSFLGREYGHGVPVLNLQGVLSASIGVADFEPGEAGSPNDTLKDDLLRRADGAMYDAKAAGKGKIVVSRDGKSVIVG